MMGLLERSLSAAVAIGILICIRKFSLHKLPKFAFRMAWGVVVLRLLLPFSVPVLSGNVPGGISRFVDSLAGNLRGADADAPATNEAGNDGSDKTDADGNKDGGSAGVDEGMLAEGLGKAGNPLAGMGSSDGGDNAFDSAGSSNSQKYENHAGFDMDGNGKQDMRENSEDMQQNSEGAKKNSENMQQNTGDTQRNSGEFETGNSSNFLAKNQPENSPKSAVSQAAGKTENSQESSQGTGKEFPVPTFLILRTLWFAGVFSVLFYFLISHLRARKLYATALPVKHPLPEIDFIFSSGLECGSREMKKFRRSMTVKERKKFRRNITVKESDRIFAPVTYGVFSPVILLPKTTDWENTAQLRMVLAHEAVHIKRFDILYKWFLAAALALHWFNPFVWAMYFLANRDIELSCDEAVVRRDKKDGKKDYALALLSYEEKRMISPTVSGFGGNAVKERMEAIMKINKTSVVGMAMAVMLVAGTTTVFAGAKENKNAPANGQEELTPGGKSMAGVNLDGENLAKGTGKNGNADAQNPVKNNTEDAQNASGKTPSANDGSSGAESKNSVKQYLCEPAYYTPEEFEEVMEIKRKEIQAELAKGLLAREDAEKMLAQIEQDIKDVKNGKQVEKPSPVYYADGTPVVNSQGGQLYVKASDIARMNDELMEKAKGNDETETVESDIISIEKEDGNKVLAGSLFEDLPGNFASAETDFSWYTYAEYLEYINQQKEEYRQMRGEWGFNSVDGWYEWDDEKIEEACRLLDENLEFIKKGGMISKPDMEGGSLIGQMMISSSEFLMKTDEKEAWGMGEEDVTAGDGDIHVAEKTTQEGGKFNSELLKKYEAFGVSADEKTENYLYQGKKIAGLRDGGFLMVNGSAEDTEEKGIYLKAVRENGELVGLEEITAEEFEKLAGRSAA